MWGVKPSDDFSFSYSSIFFSFWGICVSEFTKWVFQKVGVLGWKSRDSLFFNVGEGVSSFFQTGLALCLFPFKLDYGSQFHDFIVMN